MIELWERYLRQILALLTRVDENERSPQRDTKNCAYKLVNPAEMRPSLEKKHSSTVAISSGNPWPSGVSIDRSFVCWDRQELFLAILVTGNLSGSTNCIGRCNAWKCVPQWIASLCDLGPLRHISPFSSDCVIKWKLVVVSQIAHLLEGWLYNDHIETNLNKSQLH